MMFETDLIKTKYILPEVNPFLISRKRLSQKLDEAFQYKLTIVSAPAGYGKTTAVLDWIKSRKIPAAWYSIDRNDGDPETFWRYVIAALSHAYPKTNFTGISADRELTASNLAIGLLIDKLYGIPGDAVMVLDDFHLIENETIFQALAFFFKNVPVHFHMVLLTRKNSVATFESFYFRNQVSTINAGDLNFTSEEIKRFFEAQNYKINSEGLRRIETGTEGWAAGLVVASLAMLEQNGQLDADVLPPSAGPHIERFLRDEVFTGWTEEIKTFLLRTSVLDRFSAPLCEAVTGLKDCGGILTYLLEHNSFITPLDSRRKWFRYHHLFSKFLRNRLQESCPSEIPGLFVRAAGWYEKNGLTAEAMDAYLAGQDYAKAYALFTRIYQDVCRSGGQALLFKWMEQIPPEIHRYGVVFCTEYAWFLMLGGRLAEVEPWVVKAEASFDREKGRMTDTDRRNYLEILICLLRANIATLRLDARETSRYYVRACRIPVKKRVFIGEMNPDQPSFLRTYNGFYGRLSCVEEAYSFCRRKFAGIVGNFAAYIPLLLAESLYEQNRLNACNDLLAESFEQILELGTSGAVVPCFLTFAKMKLARGDRKGALEAVEECRKKLRAENRARWNTLLDLFVASLYLGTGDQAGAAEWMDLDRISLYDTLTAANEYEHTVFARYLILAGRMDEAVLLLGRLNAFTGKEKRLGSRIELLCLTAITYEKKNDRPRAMESLDEALTLGMEEGYARTFLDEGEPMAGLLRKYRRWDGSLKSQEKREYAKRLLQAIKDMVKTQAADMPENSACALTRTEKKVLVLLAAGRTNFEIAEALGMTVRTVKYHNTHIFGKLGVRNRTGAVSRARESGVLD